MHRKRKRTCLTGQRMWRHARSGNKLKRARERGAVACADQATAASERLLAEEGIATSGRPTTTAVVLPAGRRMRHTTTAHAARRTTSRTPAQRDGDESVSRREPLHVVEEDGASQVYPKCKSCFVGHRNTLEQSDNTTKTTKCPNRDGAAFTSCADSSSGASHERCLPLYEAQSLGAAAYAEGADAPEAQHKHRVPCGQPPQAHLRGPGEGDMWRRYKRRRAAVRRWIPNHLPSPDHARGLGVWDWLGKLLAATVSAARIAAHAASTRESPWLSAAQSEPIVRPVRRSTRLGGTAVRVRRCAAGPSAGSPRAPWERRTTLPMIAHCAGALVLRCFQWGCILWRSRAAPRRRSGPGVGQPPAHAGAGELRPSHMLNTKRMSRPTRAGAAGSP